MRFSRFKPPARPVSRERRSIRSARLVVLGAGLGLLGCSPRSTVVVVDGSSTVNPISQVVAEAYAEQGGRVALSVSGSHGGFAHLCRGEVGLIGASHPIDEQALARCHAQGIEFIELPIAYDGIAVVVHGDNRWATDFSVEELRALWSPNEPDELRRWSDIRPDWPDRPVRLFAPGVHSGTHEYFASVVIGDARSSRAEYTASEDDHVLAAGIASDPDALGFFGYGYYADNRDRLSLVAVRPSDAEPSVVPSVETISNGRYRPLSRPLYLYVSLGALQRAEVEAFVRFYLQDAPRAARKAGYVPLPEASYREVRARFETREVGTQVPLEPPMTRPKEPLSSL